MTTKQSNFDKFKYGLFVDVETTGIAFGSDDPSHNPKTGETYQAVSLGAVVVNLDTWEEVESGYWLIQIEDDITVSDRATAIHGLSREYLAEHGQFQEDVAAEFMSLVLKYFGTSTIMLGGHNVLPFDVWFIRRLLRNAGLNKVPFAQRSLDSFPVGRVLFGTNNSDELFNLVGVERSEHNALEDARAALKVFQTVHKFRTDILKL